MEVAMIDVKCDLCKKEGEIVLVSGYKLCDACARKHERGTIIEMVSDAFPVLTDVKINSVLSDMFKTPLYGFANFRYLYDRWPRGPWLEKAKCFEVPQEVYIVTCFRDYLYDPANHELGKMKLGKEGECLEPANTSMM